MNIVLFGLYGSGKSTLAAQFARRYGLEIISSGTFREYLTAKGIDFPMDKGQKPAPEVFAKFINDICEGKTRFVFDNIYTPEGLKAVQNTCKIDRYILLEIDEPTARARVITRGRDDANEEFFAHRFAAFDENIARIKQSLGTKLEIFDAALPIEVLHRRIFEN
jgi:adenylate kinase family enzyme